MNKEEIEKLLIEIALKIARAEKGCIFVIKEKEFKYENLIEQDIKPFNIFEHQRRLETLAMIDGACIIDLDGKLIAYGVNISKVKTYHGFGTRHSAAFTASLEGNTAILSSEEDRKVRIFREGVMAMQIDSLERNVEPSKAVNILESIGVGTIGTIGVTTFLPNLIQGLQVIPGVIIFGSTYFLAKFLMRNK